MGEMRKLPPGSCEGKVDCVFFFVDPLDKHPHEPDIQTLLRACTVHNVPIATNIATADLLISSTGLLHKPQVEEVTANAA